MLGYAAITPARDEEQNLPRLATALASQTHPPRRWVIVDNGSTDRTAAIARELAAAHEWISLLSIPGEADPVRGRPIVRAFMAGLAELEPQPELVVNLDADISFGPDYFERLAAAFASDRRLGIASGSGHELEDGRWCQRHLTGTTVWGAVLPLEERLGWDGIDEFRANARGWSTRTITDLPFHHHRPEGSRDGSWRSRVEQGRAAHYMGYRPSYLLMRAAFNARRGPAAAGLLWGYAGQVLRRAERESDPEARGYVRRRQRARHLPERLREARGIR
jgi:glycosyltransferase involved in cell wall biosynthesis